MSFTEIKDNMDVLKEIKTELQIDKFDSNELEELCEHLGEEDFETSLDGGEYRFILESAIWAIYVESIEELVKDCYLGMTEVPWWISIDWEQTARNCQADGYGHHFSHYDGSEYNVGTDSGEYYVFRTN